MTALALPVTDQTDLTWTEVDGVPAVWIPGDGPLRASLQFGAGVADEPAQLRGISRLVAHLASRGTPVTARVDLTRTAFDCSGDDVPATLAAVCAALAAPPGDAAAVRASLPPAPQGYREQLLYYRYGAQGPGLAGLPEYGLHWVDVRHVAWWAAERFTRANAVLWLSGPPPAGLRLPLLTGRTPDPAAATPARKHTPHGWVPGAGAGIGISAVLRRSAAWDTAFAALRAELAALPGAVVDAGYDAVDSEHVHLWWSVEGAERDALLPAFQRACEQGPSAAARDAVREQRAGLLTLLDTAANDLVVGRDPENRAEHEQRRANTTDSQVVHAVEMVGRSDLYVTPPGTGLPAPRYRPLPAASTFAVRGEEFHPSARYDGPTRSLVIGTEGVSLVIGHDAVSMRWPDVVAMLCWQDGGRAVIGRDGLVATLTPVDWRDGARAIAAIDAEAPAVRVPVPGTGPKRVPVVTTSRPRAGMGFAGRLAVAFAVCLVASLVIGSLTHGRYAVYPMVGGGGLLFRRRRRRD